jgi:NAD(P)-dependent dehydrogenase (short-subunit alcohol dehydrogenase family)
MPRLTSARQQIQQIIVLPADDHCPESGDSEQVTALPEVCVQLGLCGKVAVVSGASQGLGAAIAAELRKEGCRVALLARQLEKLQAVARSIAADDPDSVLPIRCDVLSRQDIEVAVAQIIARFGAIDILVNNAGGPGAAQRFEDLKDDDWSRTYELNVISAVRLTRATLPSMLANGWGRIINVSSESAVQPDPYMPDYNSAKAALNAFTKTLSKSYAARGVLCNAVAPAFMESPALRSAIAAVAAREQIDEDSAERQMLQTVRPHIEVKRSGRAEELAAAVAFLASERASFINGCVLRVDGGSVASI